MTTRLSIVMPVFNAVATLRGAMDSVLTQTHRDFELVAVDDGSTDASPQVLRAYAEADSRVRVLHIKHAGLVVALQRGAAEATGDVLGRMDADDLCAPDRFEKQMALMDASGADVVSCRVAWPPPGPPAPAPPFPMKIESSGPFIPSTTSNPPLLPTPSPLPPGIAHYMDWINSLTDHEAMARERFIESPLAHPTVLMRRAAFERAGGYRDPVWAEDYDLWLRLFEAGARFIKHPDTLYYWRDLPQRATRADSRYSLENFLRCKVHYLIRALLPEGRRFLIWGAGRYGKKLSKRLAERGRVAGAFIDISPRRIGGRVSFSAQPAPGEPRIPVIGADEIGRTEAIGEHGADQTNLTDRSDWSSVILVAVGARASDAARNEIRAFLNGRGFVEGRHYWCVA